MTLTKKKFLKKRKKTDLFIGPIITNSNKFDIAEQYRDSWIKNFQNDQDKKREAGEDVEDFNDDVLFEAATRYGWMEVRKQKKHLKAYLKGYKSYRFDGQNFPVLTGDFLQNSLQQLGQNKEEESKGIMTIQTEAAEQQDSEEE